MQVKLQDYQCLDGTGSEAIPATSTATIYSQLTMQWQHDRGVPMVAGAARDQIMASGSAMSGSLPSMEK